MPYMFIRLLSMLRHNKQMHQNAMRSKLNRNQASIYITSLSGDNCLNEYLADTHVLKRTRIHMILIFL